MKKVLLALVVLVVIVVAGAAIFLSTKPSLRVASTDPVEATPARLERGKYLTQHVTPCFDCHSPRQYDRYGYPPKPDKLGSGGDLCWDEDMGLEGFRLCAPNITPDRETGIGAWTDGEIMRAIREGVDKDGKALFPVMPYLEYASMSDEDVRSIVAYLRTLPAVSNTVPERILPGPLNIIVKLMPKPLSGPVAEPDHNDEVAHGHYLTTIAGCHSCHTPVDDKHQPLPGRDFAGGQVFEHKAFGKVASANLTPHQTGLGGRTRAQFVSIFKAFDNEEARDMVVAHENNTVMPWLPFAGMTEADLGAVYAYLQSVPALDSQVEKRPRPVVPPAPAPAVDADATQAVAPE